MPQGSADAVAIALQFQSSLPKLDIPSWLQPECSAFGKFDLRCGYFSTVSRLLGRWKQDEGVHVRDSHRNRPDLPRPGSCIYWSW